MGKYAFQKFQNYFTLYSEHIYQQMMIDYNNVQYTVISLMGIVSKP